MCFLSNSPQQIWVLWSPSAQLTKAKSVYPAKIGEIFVKITFMTVHRFSSKNVPDSILQMFHPIRFSQ